MNKADVWDRQIDKRGKKPQQKIDNHPYLSLIKIKLPFTANLLMTSVFTCCPEAFESSDAVWVASDYAGLYFALLLIFT